MSRIILASGSAIRKQILDGAGLNYEVIVKPVDEAAIKDSMLAENSRLQDVADALAEAKALRVSRQTDGFVIGACLLYTSPSPRDRTRSRMPSSA